MKNREKTEFVSWLALIVFLLNICWAWNILTFLEPGVMNSLTTFIFITLMVMGVFVMADKINEIHRERQLERYRIQLEPHKSDRQYLMSELAALEARLANIKIARSYNKAKCELLKHMIKELDT